MSNRKLVGSGATTGSTVAYWAIVGLLAVAVEIAAALTLGDASWDFRNYHLYNAFALLNKPFGVDIAPAHMQTFFSPTMDLVYYALARSVSSVPLLNAIYSLPHALAVVLAFALTCRLLQPRTLVEFALAGVCAAIGATGAAGGATIATTGSEMAPACFVLLALLVLIPQDLRSLPSLSRLFWAGLLIGCACGLKLTMSYLTVGLTLCLLLIPRRAVIDVVTRPAVFGVGVVLGALALTGYWWVHQWTHYGNPFFPLLNNVFRSPLAIPDSFVDRTFLPHSLGEAFAAPWMWTLRLSRAASESRLRDPRFAFALVAALACLLQAGLRRPRWRPWPVVFLACWFILGFVLWRVEFSIYRYLATLELLSGAMLAVAALPIARRLQLGGWQLGGWPLLTGSVAVLAAFLVITVYPQVNRSPPGTAPFAVDLGPVSPDSMVLLLDNEPMAYLAAFAPATTRFVATNDYFMTLDSSNPMQAWVAAAIEDHRGPLWGLDSPPEQGDRSAQTLERYGLVRRECRPVRSNISPLAIRICRLERSREVPS